MTADIKPLPERFDCTNGNTPWCQGCYTMTPDEYGDYVQWEDYERIAAAKDAEIERLRVDNKTLEDHLVHAMSEVDRLGKQAERLAGALRDALEYLHHLLPDEALTPHRAALRDHDQEVSGEE